MTIMPQPVLDLAQYGYELSRSSDGAFDLTLGPLLNLWGFGPQARAKHVPSAADIAKAKTQIGYQHVFSTSGAIEKSALVSITCRGKELQSTHGITVIRS